jgi:hypothetical protein
MVEGHFDDRKQENEGEQDGDAEEREIRRRHFFFLGLCLVLEADDVLRVG